jgi:disulfide bond formation protein DsbB
MRFDSYRGVMLLSEAKEAMMSRAGAGRLIPALVLAASAVVLAAALGAEHLGGIAPCALCFYQRYVYMAAIALSGLALALPHGPAAARARLWLTYGCGLALLAGAGIAGFHVGVEQHWWAGTDACGDVSGPPPATVEELAAQLRAAPVARCDEIPWSLFGISLAGYNLMIYLALAAVSLAGPRLMAPRGGGGRAGQQG